MALFDKFFGNFAALPDSVGPKGYRAYAIGDIHGRLDLLERLIARIEADIASRRRARNLIVFLGDLIDRGPQSAEVIERLRTWRPRGAETIFLCGNHEEVFLRVLDGEPAVLADWLRFGGKECLASYGLPAARLEGLSETEALALIQETVPDTHRQFVAGFADTFRFGDYLFVHAGIRPGVAVAEQSPKDLRWIRQPFLDDDRDHGLMVVHGHTVTEAVEERRNRIGIDTGAYRTHRLTALVVEGENRRYIEADAPASGSTAGANTGMAVATAKTGQYGGIPVPSSQ